MYIGNVETLEEHLSPGEFFVGYLRATNDCFPIFRTGRFIEGLPQNNTIICEIQPGMETIIELPGEFYFDDEDLAGGLYDFEGLLYDANERELERVNDWASKNALQKFFSLDGSPIDRNPKYSNFYLAERVGDTDQGFVSIYPFQNVFSYHNDATGYDYWISVALEASNSNSAVGYMDDDGNYTKFVWERIDPDVNGRHFLRITREILEKESKDHIIVGKDEDLSPIINKVTEWVSWVWKG